jgi:hypothetical protein
MIKVSDNKTESEVIEKITFMICYLLKNTHEYDNIKMYLNTFFTRNKDCKKIKKK